MDTAHLVFELPRVWQVGLPALALLLVVLHLRYRRRGLSRRAGLALTCLRGLALLPLVLLAARPVWVSGEPRDPARRPVMLLVDASESMSVEETGGTRYERVLEFAREQLLPALGRAGLPVEALRFAETAEPVDGAELAGTRPAGRRTNLGGAIAQAVGRTEAPPLAIVALTDGLANESADNARGLAGLVEHHVPFIGVGFGSDLGARTFSLVRVEAPNMVPSNSVFRVAAHLELTSADEVPPVDLVLLRDGRAVQHKTIQPGRGTRLWVESFSVTEPVPGAYRYTVEYLPPSSPGLKCVGTSASATVNVTGENRLRVLFVQGALTWDYKFVHRALQGDPSLRLTGLTRTSKQSIFRQNVETAGELESGFPDTLAGLAPFRAVILASLTPADLSTAQQELLARFCGELGGGVLMIGGPATFHGAWLDTRLEQILPARFSRHPGVEGLDRPFRPRLTDAALDHPVFQLAVDRPAREIWTHLPAFTQYGRVDTVKPGAQVWAEHPDDEGPQGRRILMAAQRFGAGRSAVICLQNLWRWRLAQDTDPEQFDRFWRQLIRFLGDTAAQEVTISVADQDFHLPMDVQLTLDRRPQAGEAGDGPAACTVRVERDPQALVAEHALDLPAGRSVPVSFPADRPGTYTVTVTDAKQQPAGRRTIEIRDVNLELVDTRRNLEILRQWASLSGGLALKVEECDDPQALVERIQGRVEEARRSLLARRPAGLEGWVLGWVLTGLGAEWLLRRHLIAA